MRLRADVLFFETRFILFTVYAQLFHCLLLSLSKIVCYGVQELKGKHAFRKIEIIRVWQFVSSVAQKQNRVDVIDSSRIKTMLSKECSKQSDIARLMVIGILKTYNYALKCSLTFFHVYITHPISKMVYINDITKENGNIYTYDELTATYNVNINSLQYSGMVKSVLDWKKKINLVSTKNKKTNPILPPYYKYR